MKALVTGANGLIGANLIRALLHAGHEARAFVRPASDVRSLKGLPIEFAYGDVLDMDSLLSAARGCDVLFHSAAVFSYAGMNAQELENIAVNGTTNAIEAAYGAGIPRVVFTSSSVVLGSSTRPLPRNEDHQLDELDAAPYVVAKELQERAAFERAAELDIEAVAVCPTMSVGPHGYRLGPSNGLIVSYLTDVFRTTFSGGCNIVSVHDVAKGHLLAAQKGTPGERYVLGSENLRWSAIHGIISELCGIPGPQWQANHTSSFLAASAHEFISRLTRKSPLTTRVQARMVGRYYWYEHEKAAALGYQPRPARRALAEAISWLTSSPHVSRQTRIGLRLGREVFRERKAMEIGEAQLGAVK